MASEKRLTTEYERSSLIRCLKMRHDAQFTPGVYEHSVIGRAALFLEETVDAEEVVRCKDCKHYFHFGDDVYGCRTFGMMKTKPDGFCSYGERKTDGK